MVLRIETSLPFLAEHAGNLDTAIISKFQVKLSKICEDRRRIVVVVVGGYLRKAL